MSSHLKKTKSSSREAASVSSRRHNRKPVGRWPAPSGTKDDDWNERAAPGIALEIVFPELAEIARRKKKSDRQ